MNPEKYLTLVRQYAPNLPPPHILERVAYSAEKDKANSWSGIRDINDAFRDEVSQMLYSTFTISDIHFIRYLLEQMTKGRSTWSGGGEIVLVAFMLFQLGQVEDVFRLYNAKFCGDMDTAIAIDPQLLFGAGIERTQAYLKQTNTEDAQTILSYIEEEFLPYYDDLPLEQYRDAMVDYFSVLKGG